MSLLFLENPLLHMRVAAALVAASHGRQYQAEVTLEGAELGGYVRLIYDEAGTRPLAIEIGELRPAPQEVLRAVRIPGPYMPLRTTELTPWAVLAVVRAP